MITNRNKDFVFTEFEALCNQTSDLSDLITQDLVCNEEGILCLLKDAHDTLYGKVQVLNAMKA